MALLGLPFPATAGGLISRRRQSIVQKTGLRITAATADAWLGEAFGE